MGIDRRDTQGLTLRVQTASFDEVATYADLVWENPVHYDRTRVRGPSLGAARAPSPARGPRQPPKDNAPGG